jgi:hypothetical protein
MIDLAYIAIGPNGVLDPDFCDLQLTADGTDFVAVTGRDYAAQRVIKGLETPIGGNLLAPGYGVQPPPQTGVPGLETGIADSISQLAAYLRASDAWQNPNPDETIAALGNVGVSRVGEGLNIQSSWILGDGSTITWPPTPASYPPQGS